ncbi:OsmC family protein [Alicycliphilus denitrificans]|uniref:OsmC family protein n=1 Tax=Alicycliphilus denitrificans TaxID=179636 RepID=A0A858ZTB6_9BURK|nr:OsmC family protein [Alicycliphilus denitrificans]ADV00033.1 OsmC family protein [Alicycliphilus denitrificans BC]QKD44180.1 OsmC family protein [Alicycliphilus denitrificans]
MNNELVTVELAQVADYRYENRFGGGVPALFSDEPAPLGSGQGPSPVQLLCAAVGNCLSDSLLFALRKFKQQPEPLHTTVQAEVGRNAEGRLRILQMTATLRLGVPAQQLQHLDRVLGQFESFCTVTQSVGQGIPIAVKVVDAEGSVLK